MESLVDDANAYIASFCSRKTLIALAHTSKLWNSITKSAKVVDCQFHPKSSTLWLDNVQCQQVVPSSLQYVQKIIWTDAYRDIHSLLLYLLQGLIQQQHNNSTLEIIFTKDVLLNFYCTLLQLCTFVRWSSIKCPSIKLNELPPAINVKELHCSYVTFTPLETYTIETLRLRNDSPWMPQQFHVSHHYQNLKHLVLLDIDFIVHPVPQTFYTSPVRLNLLQTLSFIGNTGFFAISSPFQDIQKCCPNVKSITLKNMNITTEELDLIHWDLWPLLTTVNLEQNYTLKCLGKNFPTHLSALFIAHTSIVFKHTNVQTLLPYIATCRSISISLHASNNIRCNISRCCTKLQNALFHFTEYLTSIPVYQQHQEDIIMSFKDDISIWSTMRHLQILQLELKEFFTQEIILAKIRSICNNTMVNHYNTWQVMYNAL